MTYEEFRALRAGFEAAVDAASDKLKTYPSGPMGLTPDAVKFSLDYQTDKTAYANADYTLKAFDKSFTRQYGKTWPVYYRKQINAARVAMLAERAAKAKETAK